MLAALRVVLTTHDAGAAIVAQRATADIASASLCARSGIAVQWTKVRPQELGAATIAPGIHIGSVTRKQRRHILHRTSVREIGGSDGGYSAPRG
jgi:hypothetical protein